MFQGWPITHSPSRVWILKKSYQAAQKLGKLLSMVAVASVESSVDGKTLEDCPICLVSLGSHPVSKFCSLVLILPELADKNPFTQFHPWPVNYSFWQPRALPGTSWNACPLQLLQAFLPLLVASCKQPPSLLWDPAHSTNQLPLTIVYSSHT